MFECITSVIVPPSLDMVLELSGDTILKPNGVKQGGASEAEWGRETETSREQRETEMESAGRARGQSGDRAGFGQTLDVAREAGRKGLLVFIHPTSGKSQRGGFPVKVV